MTSPEQADRVADLVEGALDLEASERINFLERACAGDSDLRAEVESLLKFQGSARSFIERPAYEMAAATFAGEDGELKPGDDLGGYRIRSLLGEGGMGEVYLADDAKLGRTVAIKLVKRAFNRAHLLRQFQQEERILAGLNHPHIARLYDAAVTADGLPYFIMEYVEGERLDRFCATTPWPLGARLELFRKICSAVSYAHHHLVIHRDLKPGNIRVTPEGEPKLLDFGIAKLLDDGANAADQPHPGTAAMTPDYASPEQLRGERMTTASDVYSLGVILYEMLTGKKPYRLTSRRPEEIAQAITESEPARPSEVLGNTRPAFHIPSSARDDLDYIVLRAMEKEPERRYASVGQFSEDLRRHFDGRPVLARKGTWSYRSGKFVRRHKFALAGALLLTLSLVAGIISTTWQARRAEKERVLAEQHFNEVRRLARSLMFEIHDSVADLPGSTPTRQLIVSRALEYLNNLAQTPGGDAALRRELTSAYIRVGNVQGNPNNSNLGDTSGALASYHKAKAIADTLVASDPADALARRSLGVLEEKISEVQAATGDLAGAVANAERSLAVFKLLAESDPDAIPAQQSFAISHFKLGDVLGNPNFPNNHEIAGAFQHYQAALSLLQAIPHSESDDFKTQRLLGLVEERLGTMSELTGQMDSARAHYRASEKIRLELAQEHPENTDSVRDVAIAHEKMANVLATSGDLNTALESRQQSLAIFTRLAQADPQNVLAQQSLGISYMLFADLLGAPDGPSLGLRSEAIAQYQRALEILQKYSDPADTRSKANLDLIEERLHKLQALTPAGANQ